MSVLAPDLTTMAFISMSKSISRGMATSGAIVTGRDPVSLAFLDKLRSIANMFDTQVKHDQLHFLIRNHKGVEERCLNAYAVAQEAGTALQESV